MSAAPGGDIWELNLLKSPDVLSTSIYLGFLPLTSDHTLVLSQLPWSSCRVSSPHLGSGPKQQNESVGVWGVRRALSPTSHLTGEGAEAQIEGVSCWSAENESVSHQHEGRSGDSDSGLLPDSTITLRDRGKAVL